MSGPRVVGSAEEIPLGAHALALYSDTAEARDQAVSFLRGTPRGTAARFWVPDARTAEFYVEAAGDRSPEHVGCVAILPTEQVGRVEGKLRPVDEIRSFVSAHPEGVSAGADTISTYWRPDNIPDHLEYEAWFQGQAEPQSRYICPYDLASVPPEVAPSVLRELGSHHTHVILSGSDEPGVRLLQLFVFRLAKDLPERLEPTLGWAVRNGYVTVDSHSSELSLTPLGDRLVRSWGDRSPARRAPPSPPQKSAALRRRPAVSSKARN
jgi:hypothetical protein